jgi:hypothetical protein
MTQSQPPITRTAHTLLFDKLRTVAPILLSDNRSLLRWYWQRC